MDEVKTQNAKRLLCGTAVGAANSLFGGGGVTLGGELGALLLGKLPTKTVQFIFAILQAAAGAFLFFSK